MVEVVQAEGKVACPPAPVPIPGDADPVQSIEHRRPAGADKPGDLPGGHAFVRVERFERALASQAEQGRQRDNSFYEARGSLRAGLLSVDPGEAGPARTAPSNSEESRHLFDLVLVAESYKLLQ